MDFGVFNRKVRLGAVGPRSFIVGNRERLFEVQVATRDSDGVFAGDVLEVLEDRVGSEVFLDLSRWATAKGLGPRLNVASLLCHLVGHHLVRRQARDVNGYGLVDVLEVHRRNVLGRNLQLGFGRFFVFVRRL